MTGCLAQRYQDEILKLIPEVDAVLGTTAEDSIGEVLRKLSEGEKPEKAVIENPDLVPSAARQVLTFGSFVGYLKIAFRWSRFLRMREDLRLREPKS